MNTEKKKQLIHEVMNLLLMLVLLTFIVRLWPILLFMILGLFVYGFGMLIRYQREPEVTTQPPHLALPAPVSEQEVITMAFGLLQRKITEQVTAVYPNARWVWSEAGARERFAADEPLIILLNSAGGYQKALVQTCNLHFMSLLYLPSQEVPIPNEQNPEELEEDEEPEPEPEPVDYGLLAFEWVEANMQRLNAQCNEAIAKSEDGFHISAEELPHGDSWKAVCVELERNGFAKAEALADGIQVEIKK